jgi:RNA polymerase sigma-70 factor (ECF subfamily)
MSERAAIERALATERPRLWAVCYRMTGSRADADDLLQDASTRALEAATQATNADPTGWLLRVTARVCLDHLRRRKIARRANALVDPLHGDAWAAGAIVAMAADDAVVMRDDLRFAVVVALQRLRPRQRLALVLHDVCDRPLDEIADLLAIRSDAAKALVHRARAALAAARVHVRVDIPTDDELVRRFASAIQAGDIDALVALLAPDVWGVTDGGGVVKTATRPNHGQRAVGRQWANARRKLPFPVVTELVRVNGETAIIIRLAGAPEAVVALVMLESREGRVVALRVSRDPRVTTPLGRIHVPDA